MNKEERIKLFQSMSSIERQELILMKMKAIGIEVGSGIPNKKYDSKEVYELIHIAKCFPELREKNKNIWISLIKFYFGSLNAAIINPPINPRFISTALWWKGEIWNIIVVGIRKSNKKNEPIFWFPPKIKNPDPKIRHIIAPTRSTDAIGSGIPFDEIYSTVFSNPFIFPGMAEINIAEIAILEKKSKKDLIPLFLKIEFFIILL